MVEVWGTGTRMFRLAQPTNPSTNLFHDLQEGYRIRHQKHNERLNKHSRLEAWPVIRSRP